MLVQSSVLVLTLVLCGAVSAWRISAPPPPIPGRNAATITTGWLDQVLDHYNPTDNTTWRQRYFVNTKLYQPGSPAFLFISGESTASPAWLQTGNMVDQAEEHRAIMFELEHRYYGKSHPTPDLSTANMRYLSTEQALADLAYFIQRMQEMYSLKDTKWIVFGGSYAGNLAAWARLKYPHLVHGAVASSAPVLAVTDFTGYYEVIGSVIKTRSPQCYDAVNNATAELQGLLQTTDGAQYVTKLFNLCQPLDTSVKNDIYNLQNSLSEVFAGAVQYDDDTGESVLKTCATINNPENGATVLERYAKLLYSKDCQDITFKSFVKKYGDVSWEGQTIYRSWIYQTCTEFGYYQTTDSPNQPFGEGFPLQFFIDQCTALYGEGFNKQLVDSAVERTNILYGGQHPEVTNVVFVNGGSDPWHVLSVLQDLSPQAPAVVIDGCSHCSDFYSASSYDPPQLTVARQKIAALVTEWLSQ